MRGEKDDGVTDDNQHSRSKKSPSKVAFRNEQFEQLERYMSVLPPHCQTALRLRFWKQLSYEDMAVQMDSTPEDVCRVLYHAVEVLLDGFNSRQH